MILVPAIGRDQIDAGDGNPDSHDPENRQRHCPAPCGFRAAMQDSEMVQATHGFVDLFKIGKANYLKAITTTTDWRDYTLRMIDLCGKLGARHYVKKDLQKFLPPDYPNPLRVQQHR
jgi:hypothetical protein